MSLNTKPSSEVFDLFGTNVWSTPTTQSIKYAGSKLKILPYIADIIKDLPIQTVLDGFSGSTRCGQAFSSWGLTTTSNDISAYSRVIAECFLLNTQPPQYYQQFIDHLNNLKPIDGWFSTYYGGKEDEIKKPFQLKNTQKLDAIREEIDRLNLPSIEKSVLITSLLLALDEVDSTLGHFSSYLKSWSSRSYKNLHLKVPNITQNTLQHTVLQQDIFEVVEKGSWDLAYFDPPYGSGNEKMPPSRVRYQAYYHFWNSVVLNDKPEVFGLNGRREDSRDKQAGSIFEEFRKDETGDFLAINAVKKLIQETKVKYVLLSYNSGSPTSQKQLFNFLETQNILTTTEIDYKKNVMAKMTSTKQWLPDSSTYKEYLFLMQK